MMDMSFFYVYYSEEDSSPYGVAEGPPGKYPPLLPRSGVEVSSWSQMKFELRGGRFADYMASDLAGGLCSTKLKEIVDEHASLADRLQWLDVTVVRSADEERPYWVLHFPVDFPVLDMGKSLTAADGFIVKPVLSSRGVAGHEVIGLPSSYGQTWFVSQRVKEAIENARCTNVGFGPVPVADS